MQAYAIKIPTIIEWELDDVVEQEEREMMAIALLGRSSDPCCRCANGLLNGKPEG